MNRRAFLKGSAALLTGAGLGLGGCRGHQYGQVMNADQKDMVGSHAAGSETFRPLIEESVARLLGRQAHGIQQVGGHAALKQICFVGLKNESAEELGDFKDQIVSIIEEKISNSGLFVPLSRTFVEAGIRQLHVRPEDLLLPANRRAFQQIMEGQGHPFDYMLFARLNSGTTRTNHSSQRDYRLTLELVNVHTGTSDVEAATIRKGYHRTHVGWW